VELIVPLLAGFIYADGFGLTWIQVSTFLLIRWSAATFREELLMWRNIGLQIGTQVEAR